MAEHWSGKYFGMTYAEVNCLDLCAMIYRSELGETVEYTPDWQAGRKIIDGIRSRGASIGIALKLDLVVGRPKEFDIALMASGQYPHHVGVYINGGFIIHSVEGSGVVIDDMSTLKIRGMRVNGYLRRA